MGKLLTQKIVLAILCIGLVLAGSVCLHARLFSNNSEDAFDGGSGGASGTNGLSGVNYAYSIRELVIKGAANFLKGQSHINNLSQQVELSDMERSDFSMLQKNVNSALDSVYYTWYYYQELQSKAAAAPYNQGVINKLAAFDYDGFQKKHGLIKDVFLDVKAYLAKGDVRGVYARTSNDVCKIYFLLEDVQVDLYKWTIPNNTAMWNLNQECAKTLLFGQYVARVFNALK